MKSKKMISITIAIALLICGIYIGSAFAIEPPEGYPDGPIRMVVPYGPGGGSDVFSRAVAIEARKELDAPLVIENKPGASGVIAMEYVEGLPADGQTLLSGTLKCMIYQYMLGKTSVNQKDFEPVIRVQHDMLMMAVRKGGPYDDVHDVIEDAKKNPGEQTWAFVGATTGSTAMGLEVLEKGLGLEVNYLGLDKGSKLISRLLGGHIDVIFDEPATLIELINADKVKPVLVFAKERVKDFPDVPTTKELGADAYYSNWRGIVVKKGTPEPVIEYLHDVFKKAMESKFYKDYEKSHYLHLRDGYLSSEDFKKFIQEEVEFYENMYKKKGMYNPQE